MSKGRVKIECLAHGNVGIALRLTKFWRIVDTICRKHAYIMETRGDSEIDPELLEKSATFWLVLYEDLGELKHVDPEGPTGHRLEDYDRLQDIFLDLTDRLTDLLLYERGA